MISKYISNNSDQKILYLLWVLASISIAFLVYLPGLKGDFIFDDTSNLKHISVFSQYFGLDALIKFVLSNEAGPLKRPISTLSFLLNARTWPADPYYFKLTNILIHLTNGILLYIVTCKLLLQLKLKNINIRAVSVLNMSIWLLHPFFVSTTLYVVQRMSMLPTLFVLLGIYFYLLARQTLITNKTKGVIYLISSIGLCTILATLSKENGIILPLLILMIESILAKQNINLKLNKRLKLIFLILPSIIIISAFIYKIPGFVEGYNIREFSPYERLLTQSRVAINYLLHLFTPQYLTESVYTDGFIISQSLLQPLSTLFSILLIISLITISLMFKKKYPIISLSILFFFIALIIESTIIPLEIYFEHRSYLPSLFVFLPIAVFLITIVNKSKVYYLIIFSLITYLTFNTYLRTKLWSNNNKLITITSIKFPQSVRAINRRASNLYTQGHTVLAIKILQNAILTHSNLTLKLNVINLKCGLGKSSRQDFEELIKHIQHTKITKDDRNSLIAVFNLLADKDCVENSLKYYQDIVTAIKNNPGYSNPILTSTINFHEAFILLRKGEYNESLLLFQKYFDDYLKFEDIIYISKELIELNQNQHALALLEKLKLKLNQITHRYNDYGFLDQVTTLIEKLKYN